MEKLIRITTVPVSLKTLLKGQHRFMSARYEVIAVSSSGKDLQAVEKNEGVRVVPVEMTRTISPIKDLKSLWQLYRLFKREKPLIVHTHTPKAGTLGMIAAKLAGVPNRLHTIAGLPLLEATGAKRTLLDVVEKITYACASMIYPNSYGLQDIIVQNNYTIESKLKVLANGSSNGIDTQHFNPSLYTDREKQKLRKELNIEADDFVFVFVGRLVGDKGINELVEVFGRVGSGEWKVENGGLVERSKKSGAESQELGVGSYEFKNKTQSTVHCKLLLVGPTESELDPLLPKTLAELERNQNIISVGYQNDVRPYLSIANALVFPSYREGFPNVVMQAGAMGLPSIVTDINGCNEIIIEGENGAIIPTRNNEVLYEKMISFVENPDETERMAANARKLIVDRYEQKLVWKAILEEYRLLTDID